MRTFLVVTAFLASLAIPVVAHADPDPDANPEKKDDAAKAPAEKERSRDLLNVGVLGGIGFPRPLAIEGVVGLGGYAMIGAEYSLLPKITVGAVDTRLWAAAGTLRVFPFRGAFFIGLRAGYQELSAGATVSATGVGSYSENVDVGSWFLNPRIGFLWRFEPFTVGIDAGIQIPVSSSVSRTASSNATGIDYDARITSAADTIGRSPLPTIDLLKVGMVF